ncbi:hypothetical protein SAMN05444414_1366 [Roseovarius marisflavi]|uniref:Uncharacterized protein n=1 Tax=Roseovarius marisflavi TaxID=1054996 RepID=A0A1M7D7A5_9RHOB|nr:hypothetical protein [Roseovarius marisflavi]SHL75376.1 hypothetical protein SAMN05444414_1366 [Roseovarius marisflavi]
MKQIVTAIALSLSLAASPVLAFGIDVNSLTPVLTYPDPAPAPVTQGNSGINK